MDAQTGLSLCRAQNSGRLFCHAVAYIMSNINTSLKEQGFAETLLLIYINVFAFEIIYRLQ